MSVILETFCILVYWSNLHSSKRFMNLQKGILKNVFVQIKCRKHAFWVTHVFWILIYECVNKWFEVILHCVHVILSRNAKNIWTEIAPAF